MKINWRALCSVGTLLYAGEVFAMNDLDADNNKSSSMVSVSGERDSSSKVSAAKNKGKQRAKLEDELDDQMNDQIIADEVLARKLQEEYFVSSKNGASSSCASAQNNKETFTFQVNSLSENFEKIVEISQNSTPTNTDQKIAIINDVKTQIESGQELTNDFLCEENPEKKISIKDSMESWLDKAKQMLLDLPEDLEDKCIYELQDQIAITNSLIDSNKTQEYSLNSSFTSSDDVVTGEIRIVHIFGHSLSSLSNSDLSSDSSSSSFSDSDSYSDDSSSCSANLDS